MTDQEPFPLVLLGAGASAPAGVPTAVEMTRRMMEACRQDAQHDYLRALSAIYGGLQMGLGQSEVPRLGCPDVEQVLNAASLLGDRFNLEFAPFVATWHPIIGELERRNFSRLDAQAVVSSAMSRLSSIGRRGTAMSETEALSAFGAVLQEALSKMGDHLSQYPDGALFRGLNAYLTGKLIEFTWLQSPEKLVYLDPLLAAARHVPIAVATLNYDNAVELRGARLGVPCETGLSAWSATGQLPLVATGIDLMKLHGSVRWRWSTRSAKSAIGLSHREISETNDKPKSAGFNRRYTEDEGHLLGVIFGGHNKLIADGPFLDLLAKFKDTLEKHRRLLVVGYSFRDPHVNHFITRWLYRDASRQVTIVDQPGSPDTYSRLFEAGGYRLVERLTFDPIGAESGFAKYFSKSA